MKIDQIVNPSDIAQLQIVTTTFVGPTYNNGQEFDKWKITIKTKRANAEFEYFTGTGHRIKTGAKTVTVCPKPESVLWALLMDGQASRDHFDDFCANFGLDTDSRKAHNIYKACEKTDKKLMALFTLSELAHLYYIFEDFEG